MNAFMIEDLRMVEDVFTPFDVQIKNANIFDKDTNENEAYFKADGIYAGKDFLVQATLEKDKKSYIVPKIIPFSIQLGDYSVKATLRKKAFEVLLTGLIFEKGARTSPSKDYIFVESGGYKTDNPLACLYLNAGNDLQQCDQYLESGN